MKTVLIFALGGLAALSSAQAIRLDSPGNWSFDYAGHYAFAAATGGGSVSTLLGTTLGAQLALLQGNVSGTQKVSIAQSGSSVSTSPLAFTATGPSGILPGLGAFLVDVLDTADGSYTGTLTGTSLALHGPSFADLTSTVDARVAGTGLLYSLKASLIDSALMGTVDGVSGGVGNHVLGSSGSSSLLAISLSTQAYVGGFTTISVPMTQIGAIETDTTSWSLARPAVQATPEPGSLAALGLGAFSFMRRKRRSA